MWSSSEGQNSSTWKELTAVRNVLLSLLDFIKDKRLKSFTDNQNIVSIITKGSMKGHLQDISGDIYQSCLRHNISLDVKWVPRTQNEKADFISRNIDSYDWSVSDYIFSLLNLRWGPHEIDWFASDHNFKLPVFYSRCWNVNSIGIDAFTFDWSGINGWFVPPVCVLLKVFLYMKQCKAYETVILPLWRSASFCSFLCPDGIGLNKYVVDVVYLPTDKSNYIPGRGKGGNGGGESYIFMNDIYAKVFNREIADLPDELLNSLNLIPDLLTESKTANTVEKYYYGFRRWKSWALSHQIPEYDILPSKPFHVALYLASLVQSFNTSSLINEAFYSIK
ncbi:unnamed protein product [Mytilus coruscus]|uniref:RNase H type-1 domain-containing protein n=1 Tax=Mytilus coruscus TaxID=42192 RepID=A0A6J8DUK1_MYTCO|nr:unnamed protein product [Mytilus coruscus]